MLPALLQLLPAPAPDALQAGPPAAAAPDAAAAAAAQASAIRRIGSAVTLLPRTNSASVLLPRSSSTASSAAAAAYAAVQQLSSEGAVGCMQPAAVPLPPPSLPVQHQARQVQPAAQPQLGTLMAAGAAGMGAPQLPLQLQQPQQQVLAQAQVPVPAPLPARLLAPVQQLPLPASPPQLGSPTGPSLLGQAMQAQAQSTALTGPIAGLTLAPQHQHPQAPAPAGGASMAAASSQQPAGTALVGSPQQQAGALSAEIAATHQLVANAAAQQQQLLLSSASALNSGSANSGGSGGAAPAAAAAAHAMLAAQSILSPAQPLADPLTAAMLHTASSPPGAAQQQQQRQQPQQLLHVDVEQLHSAQLEAGWDGSSQLPLLDKVASGVGSSVVRFADDPHAAPAAVAASPPDGGLPCRPSHKRERSMRSANPALADPGTAPADKQAKAEDWGHAGDGQQLLADGGDALGQCCCRGSACHAPHARLLAACIRVVPVPRCFGGSGRPLLLLLLLPLTRQPAVSLAPCLPAIPAGGGFMELLGFDSGSLELDASGLLLGYPPPAGAAPGEPAGADPTSPTALSVASAVRPARQAATECSQHSGGARPRQRRAGQ